MPIIQCPKCAKKLRVEDRVMGKTVRCPVQTCQATFVAEEESSDSVSTASAPAGGTFQISCPSCQHLATFPQAARGKRVRCRKCSHEFTADAQATQEPAAPAPAAPAPAVAPSPAPAAPRHPEPSEEEFEEDVADLLSRPLKKPGFLKSLLGRFSSGVLSPEARRRLKAVALDPDNAILRLECARWLSDQGEPLGDFIRLNYAIDRLPDEDDRQTELNDRWSQLLEAHGKGWVRPLKSLGLEPMIGDVFYPALWMHNGIVDDITVDRDGVLPEKARELFAGAPGLQRLTFHGCRAESSWGDLKFIDYRPDIPAIAELPQMEQIRSLTFSSLQISLEDLEALVSSDFLQNLTELDISSDDLGEEGARLIASAKNLSNLKSLKFTSSNIGSEGLQHLAASPHLARLEKLELRYNKIGPEGAQALAASPHLRSLKSLDLGNNPIGPKGGAALGSSANLRHVTHLNLEDSEFGPEGAKALATSPHLTHLEELKISGNKITGKGAQALAASTNLANVTILEIGRNEIDAEGAKALMASPHLRKLKELGIGYNPLGDAGAKALAAAGFKDLVKLDLNDAQIGPAGARAIASSATLAGLTTLSLSYNELGPEGAMALAGSSHLTSLEYLYMDSTRAGDEGEEALQDRYGSVVSL